MSFNLNHLLHMYAPSSQEQPQLFSSLPSFLCHRAFCKITPAKTANKSMSHVHMAIYFLQASNKHPAGTKTFEKIFLFPQGGSTAKVMNPCIWHSHFWLTSKTTQFVAACPSLSFISYCSRSHICLE
jgi:hypothetical protein